MNDLKIPWLKTISAIIIRLKSKIWFKLIQVFNLEVIWYCNKFISALLKKKKEKNKINLKLYTIFLVNSFWQSVSIFY